jgi:hypothetical protein
MEDYVEDTGIDNDTDRWWYDGIDYYGDTGTDIGGE